MKNIKPQALIYTLCKACEQGFLENRLAFSYHLARPYFNNALAFALPYKYFGGTSKSRVNRHPHW
jgi:hypothetical protein